MSGKYELTPEARQRIRETVASFPPFNETALELIERLLGIVPAPGPDARRPGRSNTTAVQSIDTTSMPADDVAPVDPS